MRSKLGKVGSDLGGMGSKMDEAAKKEENLASKSENIGGRIGGVFKTLGAEVNNWGLPFGEMLDHVGEKMSGVEGHTSTFTDKLASVGKVASVGAAAGAVAFTGMALKWDASYKQIEAQLAATGNMSSAQANAIGKAVNSMAGDTTISSDKMLSALQPVVGQLEDVTGHTLTAKEATSVLSAATNLAEATHSSLGGALQTESKLIQTYGQSLNSAGSDSDVLFNASTRTGQSVGALTQMVTRIKGQLGVLAPSLSDTSAFMLDLAEHGETGRAVMGAVSSAFNTLLKAGAPVQAGSKAMITLQDNQAKSAAALAKAQQSLAVVQASLGTKAQLSAVDQDRLRVAQEKVAAAKTPAAQQAAQQALITLEDTLHAKMQLTLADRVKLQNAETAVAAAESKHASAQQALQSALAGTSTAAEKMGIHVYDAHGQFVGMASIIAQLQPLLKGHTQAQQLETLQTLFGAQANRKLLDTILAGPAAYTAATQKVTAQGAAHDAAEKATNTLAGTSEKLESKVHSLGVQYGEWLTPKLVEAEKEVMKVVDFFEHNKAAAIALASVIGGVLTLTIGAFVYKTVAGLAQNVGDMFKGIGSGIDKVKQQISGGAGEQSLAGEADSAEASLSTAADSLKESAAQLSAAADKLSGAGKKAATDMEAGASTSEGDLAAGGAAAEGDMTAGAAVAEADLAAGGAAAEGELSAGGATVEGELAAGGATAEGELAAGGSAGAAGAAGAGAAGAEGELGVTAAGGATAAAGGLGASAILPAAAAGFASFQITKSLLGDPKHPTAIGKALQDALGLGPTQVKPSTSLGAGSLEAMQSAFPGWYFAAGGYSQPNAPGSSERTTYHSWTGAPLNLAVVHAIYSPKTLSAQDKYVLGQMGYAPPPAPEAGITANPSRGVGLAEGAYIRAEQMVTVHPNEVVLPLMDQRRMAEVLAEVPATSRISVLRAAQATTSAISSGVSTAIGAPSVSRTAYAPPTTTAVAPPTSSLYYGGAPGGGIHPGASTTNNYYVTVNALSEAMSPQEIAQAVSWELKKV